VPVRPVALGRALGPVRAFTFGVRVRAHCVNHRLDPTGPLHTPRGYSQRGTLSTHNGVLEGMAWRGMIAVGCVVVRCRHGRILVRTCTSCLCASFTAAPETNRPHQE
jgi:hypothetical protein